MTVREAVELISAPTVVPEERVRAVARRLLDDDRLPKSAGRHVKHLTATEFAAFYLTAMVSLLLHKKINESTRLFDEISCIRKPQGQSFVEYVGDILTGMCDAEEISVFVPASGEMFAEAPPAGAFGTPVRNCAFWQFTMWANEIANFRRFFEKEMA